MSNYDEFQVNRVYSLRDLVLSQLVSSILLIYSYMYLYIARRGLCGSALYSDRLIMMIMRYIYTYIDYFRNVLTMD